MRAVAVVPARGGSKGVPRKNLRQVAGCSLVGWAVRAGLEARRVNRVIVSSDDDEILAEGARHGATALRRPMELATDGASTDSVLVDVGKKLAWDFDALVVLQPTVPVRRAGLVDECVARLEATGADSLLTLVPLHFVWRRAVRTKHDGSKVLGSWVQSNVRGARPRRQDFADEDLRFQEDGAVFVARAALLRDHGVRLGGYVEAVENEPTVDIDREEDFAVAEALLTRHARMSVTATV